MIKPASNKIKIAHISKVNGTSALPIKQNRLPPFLITTPHGMEELGLFDHILVASILCGAHIAWLSKLGEVECPF